MKQMYKEIKTPAIAKKRYSFKRGYLQIILADKNNVKSELMQALGISRNSYFSTLLNSGILDISITKYNHITAIFNRYGIQEVWEISEEK